MGCDIFCFVEKIDGDDGKWKQIKGFKSDAFYEGCEGFGTEEHLNSSSPIRWRSYALFAFLAGVRNDRYDIVPISEPKGRPKDMSIGFEWEFDDHDRHSASWLTVKEIIESDSMQTIESPDRGQITIKEELSGFFSDTLEQLKTRCDKKDFSDVRIVFCFEC